METRERIEIGNHANFKRLLQGKENGVQIGAIDLELLQVSNGAASRGRLFVGLIRPIIRFNGTGVWLATHGTEHGSFMDYGKASEWQFDGDTAHNLESGHTYRLIRR